MPYTERDIEKTGYYTVNEYGESMRVRVVGLSDATICRPWYGYAVEGTEIKYESIDMGNSWQDVPDWTGFYEIPECIRNQE